MEYRFRLKEGKKTIPVITFENPDFALAGEFLLAERSFLTEILQALQEENGAFSGNAFSLEKRDNAAVISNDVTGVALTMDAQELTKLTEDYRAEVRRCRKRKP